MSKQVKVGQFREQMDFVGYAMRSLQSAATPTERNRESDSLRRRLVELRAMECPRAKDDDFSRAASIVARGDELLREAGAK